MAKNNKKSRKRKSNRAGDSEAADGGAPSEGKKRKHAHPTSSRAADPSTSSLAQRLKKHRGVAANSPAPPAWKDGGGGRRHAFLTPQDDPRAFADCLKTSFGGFHYDAPDTLPSSLHNEFESSFRGMEEGGLFLYDVVQPGKKRLTRTSVTRTLVGDPGSTYKYLGLRLFSHPWVDVDEDGDAIDNKHGATLRRLGYSGDTTSALITMGRVNSKLTDRSNAMLQKHVSPNITPVGLVGSADFNLTLVNKMESTSDKRDLKKEVAYGMGKISVGWHRDSGLRDFSSIAVYQSLKDAPRSKNSDSSWGVALRAMDGGAGGPLDIPPLLVPLPSGALYYMLDDFNHTHEHAVIAGSGGIRYSSTHRVAREGQGTWQYMRDKIRAFSAASEAFDMSSGVVKGPVASTLSSRKKKSKLLSHARALLNLMAEIEFEWLRQWFVQGKRHAEKHSYWHRPIKFLCDSYCELERVVSDSVKLLRKQSKNGPEESDVTVDLFDVFIEALSHRSELRETWGYRYRDPIFDNIPAEERPFSCPCLDREVHAEGQLSEDLDALVADIRQWRSSYVAEEAGATSDKNESKKKKKAKSGSLTKKESKSRASNWERLKSSMK